MSSRLWQYEAYLRSKGRRLTNERRRIASAILALEGPLHERDLPDRIEMEASRATLYRVSAQLAESGLIRFAPKAG